MKGSNRQRSPGNLIRTGDNMDEPSNTSNTAEPDEFVPNVHPPTDDEGVCTSDSFKYLDSNEILDNKHLHQKRIEKLLLCESNAWYAISSLFLCSYIKNYIILLLYMH